MINRQQFGNFLPQDQKAIIKAKYHVDQNQHSLKVERSIRKNKSLTNKWEKQGKIHSSSNELEAANTKKERKKTYINLSTDSRTEICQQEDFFFYFNTIKEQRSSYQ